MDTATNGANSRGGKRLVFHLATGRKADALLSGRSDRSVNDMINGIPCGIAIIDCYNDGRVDEVYANGECQKMITLNNTRGGQVDAYKVLEVVHPDDRQGLINEIRACAGEGRDGSFDFRILMADENVKWLSAHSRVVSKNENKNTLYVVYTDIDQDYNRRYERELQLRQGLTRDSEAYFQLNLTKGIIEEYASVKTGTKSHMRFFASSDEFREKILARVSPEDRPRVENTLFITGLRKAYDSGATSAVTDFQGVNDKGDACWLRGAATIIKRPGTDEVMAFVYCRDITVEKKNRLALESILQEDIDSIVLINVKTAVSRVVKNNGDLTDAADGCEMPHDGQILKMLELGIIQDDAAENYKNSFTLANLISLLEKSQLVTLTHRARNRRGQLRWKRTLAYYLDESRDDIVFSRRDITSIHDEEERQKLALRAAFDEVNRANNAKNEFISRMSHDMRTAMNAVVGLVKLLKGEELSRRSREYLDGIDQASGFLSGFIRDILDIDGLSRGEVKLNEEPLAPDEFKNSLISITKPVMDEKGITFSAELDEFDTAILVDRARFLQIAAHLLSNAAKYTSQGGAVSVVCEKLPAKGEKLGLRFRVRDSGRGISEEFMKVIFEPFTQETDQSRSELCGSGLGLALVKKLLTAMDGDIKVSSKLGEGSEFEFYIYCKPVPAREPEEKYAGLCGQRLLVVDDNELNRRILGMLLERVGCLADYAENGLEAAQKFSESDVGYYQAILMDIRMPVMDGLEATAKIRDSGRLDSQTVPVISITADVLNRAKDDPDAAGITAQLMKPIDADKLFLTIAELTALRTIPT